MGLTASPPAGLPVDGHVHLHACFDPQVFLDHALGNFRRAPAGPTAGAVRGVLLLTESAGERAFSRLRAAAGGRPQGAWSFETTDEEPSLLARRADEALVLVAGLQIVTRESLEVLALACTEDVPDGLALSSVLERVRERGGLPVVPWGFGKWWLARRRVVAGLLEREDPSSFFLGDNGGRLGLAPRPRLFRIAEDRGFRILPGSDPLPFPGQVRRPGSFGFVLRSGLPLDRPADGLKRALRSPDFRPQSYGHGAGPIAFARDQLAMQWHKRRRGGRR